MRPVYALLHMSEANGKDEEIPTKGNIWPDSRRWHSEEEAIQSARDALASGTSDCVAVVRLSLKHGTECVAEMGLRRRTYDTSLPVSRDCEEETVESIWAVLGLP